MAKISSSEDAIDGYLSRFVWISQHTDSSSKTEVPTHVLFDFFGTLVNYASSNLSNQGHAQSFSLLQAAGAKLGYDQFIVMWSALFDEFNEAAEQSHREFSMIELTSTFIRRTIGEPDEALVRDSIQTYLSEWNQGVQYLDGLCEMLGRLNERFTLAVITNTYDPDLVPNHLECMTCLAVWSHP